jgi:hypothetical protein
VSLEPDRWFSVEWQNLIEPRGSIPPAMRIRNVYVPSSFMKAIGFCHRQRRTGLLRVNPIAILGCVDRKQFDYISIKAVPVKRTVSRRRGSRNQLEIATVASHSERLASHVSLLPKGNDPFPLGSLDHNPSQEYWATGGRRDLEEDLPNPALPTTTGYWSRSVRPTAWRWRRVCLMRLIQLLVTLYRLKLARWRAERAVRRRAS